MLLPQWVDFLGTARSGLNKVEFKSRAERKRFFDVLDKQVHEFSTFIKIHDKLAIGNRVYAASRRLVLLKKELATVDAQKTFNAGEYFLHQRAVSEKIGYLERLLEKDKHAVEKTKLLN